MKPAISIAIASLLSLSLIVTANAGTVTTTTVTTKTITTKSSCYKKHHKKVTHKHYKRYRTCYSGGCSGYVAVYDDWDQCPGGAYNCYFDLQGNYMRQTYLPVGYGRNVKYECLASDDPDSCAGIAY